MTQQAINNDIWKLPGVFFLTKTDTPILILSSSLTAPLSNSEICPYYYTKQFSSNPPFNVGYTYKFSYDTLPLLPPGDDILIFHDEVLVQLKFLKIEFLILTAFPTKPLKSSLLPSLISSLTPLTQSSNFGTFLLLVNVPKSFLSLNGANSRQILLSIVASPYPTPLARSFNVSFSTPSFPSSTITI